ncbi:hypothetical protein HPP92_020770 [Vanilla planifolia]|uniref:Fungal lipase-like domain-containing protein n=1 Tax=Vanilla planifolia TaxID=51239 RepID=A0A835UGK0_VANPL|nr:hypothetical protein HPP92_020770 [Vanilla planifolia]
MGRTEKTGDAVNLLNFAGPRSLAELRGVRADGIKNIDSISSLEPESKKRLKEAKLLGYDVSVSFEAILVASNNRKEENEVNLHSRKDAHKGKHSRRDEHKGNFEIYDWIGVDLPKRDTPEVPKIRRDLEENHRFLAWESLRGSVRFAEALKTLIDAVVRFGSFNICIGSHSLGAGFALQVYWRVALPSRGDNAVAAEKNTEEDGGSQRK